MQAKGENDQRKARVLHGNFTISAEQTLRKPS
jgi:hypothetical protein